MRRRRKNLVKALKDASKAKKSKQSFVLDYKWPSQLTIFLFFVAYFFFLTDLK